MAGEWLIYGRHVFVVTDDGEGGRQHPVVVAAQHDDDSHVGTRGRG